LPMYPLERYTIGSSVEQINIAIELEALRSVGFAAHKLLGEEAFVKLIGYSFIRTNVAPGDGFIAK